MDTIATGALVVDPMVAFPRGNPLLAAGEPSGLGGAMPAAPLLTLSCSRGAEARADAASLRLLQAAGYGPMGWHGRSAGSTKAAGRRRSAGCPTIR